MIFRCQQIFFKTNFLKNSFWNTIRVLNSSNQDQARCLLDQIWVQTVPKVFSSKELDNNNSTTAGSYLTLNKPIPGYIKLRICVFCGQCPIRTNKDRYRTVHSECQYSSIAHTKTQHVARISTIKTKCTG